MRVLDRDDRRSHRDACRHPRVWLKAGRDRWYSHDAAFDAEIRSRFLATRQKAAAGDLSSWEASDEGALALTIVLDQFRETCFAATPGPFQAMRWPVTWQGARSTAASMRGPTHACANSSICRSSIRKTSTTSSAAWGCSGNMTATPTTSDMPRTTPTSSAGSAAFRTAGSRAGPADHGRGAGLSRWRRVFRLMTER